MDPLTVSVFITSILLTTVSGKQYVICVDTYLPLEVEGKISSPSITDFRKSTNQVNCTSVMEDIPAESWVGIFNDKRFTNRYYQPGSECPEQRAYLSIYHPTTGYTYFCKDTAEKVMFTAYSASTAKLQFNLISTLTSLQYDPGLVDFGLVYRVGRVIYRGQNTVTTEEAKTEDTIVSHRTYPDYYPTGIDSTLTLTGLRLSATVSIIFSKMNFHSSCSDYLEISGLHNRNIDVQRLCSKVAKLQSGAKFRTTSTRVTFQFVSTSPEGGIGFRFDYRVHADTGCSELQIPHTSVAADSSDSTSTVFTVTCDEGLHFNNTETTSKQISCESGEWSLLPKCEDQCGTDTHCLQVCGDNNRLEHLQCVCQDKDLLRDDGIACKEPAQSPVDKSGGITIFTIIGLSTAAAVLSIAAITGVAVFLGRQRRRRAQPNKPVVNQNLLSIMTGPSQSSSEENSRIPELQQQEPPNNSEQAVNIEPASGDLVVYENDGIGTDVYENTTAEEDEGYEYPDHQTVFASSVTEHPVGYLNMESQAEPNGSNDVYEQVAHNQNTEHSYTSLLSGYK